jgi:hypothetical protein
MMRSVQTAVLLVVMLGGLRASAGVVVLDNWTAGDIEFIIRQTDGKEWRYTLPHGDVVPIPAAGPLGITFDAGGQPRRESLAANTIYCFAAQNNRLELAELRAPAVAGNPRQPGAAAAQPGAPSAQPLVPGAMRPAVARPPAAVAPTAPLVTIPVMIVADDQEPMAQEAWEKKIRARLADASAIFEHHCRVRFDPVAVGTWAVNPKEYMFDRAMGDFRNRVPLKPPVRLAIGFTSRFRWVPEEHRVGETGGPLFSHILIRNAVPGLSEPEQLEILVHELGHYLGAVHVPHSTSVMRPGLGDQKSRLRDFRIRFDAPNTLVMYLVAEEMRVHPIVTLAQLSPERKAALRGVYTAIAQAMPHDATAQQYLAILNVNLWMPPVFIVPAPKPPAKRPAPVPATRPAPPPTEIHASLSPAPPMRTE